MGTARWSERVSDDASLDKETLGVMVSGAEYICDEAERKCLDPNYYRLGEEIKRDNLARWKRIRANVRRLARRLQEVAQ